MTSTDVMNYINQYPGFLASIPTQGHVKVESALWAGHVTYYPKEGKLDISAVKAVGDVEQSLNQLASFSGGVGAFHILACGMSTDLLAQITLKLA